MFAALIGRQAAASFSFFLRRPARLDFQARLPDLFGGRHVRFAIGFAIDSFLLCHQGIIIVFSFVFIETKSCSFFSYDGSD